MDVSALLFLAALIQRAADSATEDFSYWPSRSHTGLYVIAFIVAVAAVAGFVWMIRRNNQKY